MGDHHLGGEKKIKHFMRFSSTWLPYTLKCISRIMYFPHQACESYGNDDDELCAHAELFLHIPIVF